MQHITEEFGLVNTKSLEDITYDTAFIPAAHTFKVILLRNQYSVLYCSSCKAY